jgi:Bacterial Ig domain
VRRFAPVVLLAIAVVGVASHVEATAMTWSEFESYWPQTEHRCWKTDDRLDFDASGDLAPGASFTFTPRGICLPSEMMMTRVKLTWSGATVVDLSAVVAARSNNTYDNAQIGQTVHAERLGTRNEANLSLQYTSGIDGAGFPPEAPALTPYTLTNTGTVTATVVLEGQITDWTNTMRGGPDTRADNDNDGWSDAVEIMMGYIDPNDHPPNYMRVEPFTTPVGVVDSGSPADQNADGVIDATDVAAVQAHEGDGTNCGMGEVIAQAGQADACAWHNMWDASLVPDWRRYDLNMDGLVDDADTAIATVLTTQAIPPVSDVVAPVVRVRIPVAGTTVPRRSGVNVYSSAWDVGSFVERVELWVDGRLKSTDLDCSNRRYSWNAPKDIPPCLTNWQTPAKTGAYTLTVKAFDAAGNVAVDSITVNVV